MADVERRGVKWVVGKVMALSRRRDSAPMWAFLRLRPWKGTAGNTQVPVARNQEDHCPLREMVRWPVGPQDTVICQRDKASTDPGTSS